MKGARVAVLGVAVLAAASCAGGDKAGGPAAPVELVLTNSDSGSGVRTTPAAGRFVELVEELSGGQVTITVDTSDYGTDGREVDAVASGRADLGWTGTRVFDTLGVTELQPLQAPFLLDSYELQAAVLASDVPAAMLPGLERLGVEPLAILADGLRHPASARAPLLSPGDWAGSRVWLLDSDIQAEAVAALGGTALHGGDIRQELTAGEAEGLESMWLYYTLSADFLYAPYVVANEVLAPRTTALFANPDSMAALTDEQRGWIHEAAAGAVDWSIEHAADGDDEEMAYACRYGARVAVATDEDLGALRDAVAPVYDRLRADPATSATMAAIEALAADLDPPAPPAVPAGCLFSPDELAVPAPQPLTGPGPTGDFPLGTYRYELSDEEVLQAGDPDSILQDTAAGVFTWEMGDGTWHLLATPAGSGVENEVCDGWYSVDGNLVTFTHDPLVQFDHSHCLPPVWTARWAPSGDDGADIQWGPPSLAIMAPYISLMVWERIG